MDQKKSVVKKLLPFEDNVGLSEEEEDIMLAQCIRSGMPKVSWLYKYDIKNKFNIKNSINKEHFSVSHLGHFVIFRRNVLIFKLYYDMN